ncbi:glycine oxidase ThiO [soil metagenome]
MSETLIVGGGLIGLAIGWQLAKAGRSVTVIERDARGSNPTGASWAAAGMLAPLAEVGFNEPALLALSRSSLEMYPNFAAELEADAGQGVGYRTEGTLIVALDSDDAAWLRRQYDFQQSLGLPTRWMDGNEAREQEPHLAPTVTAAAFAPTDHQVDNRLLVTALREAFTRAGGDLREGMEVVRIQHDGDRARGVWVRPSDNAGADPELLEAPQIVVCAGAWTRLLMANNLPAPAVPPIRPVKGQLLSLTMSPLLKLSYVIRTRRVYLVPKLDGRLVIGATSEDVGFDTQLTAGGLLELLRDAWEAVPGVYDLPVRESWAGLRPASRDHAPVLGPTPLSGLHLAVGHYRNGVLLTPATARLMCEFLLTGEVPEAMQPFGLARFHKRTRVHA